MPRPVVRPLGGHMISHGDGCNMIKKLLIGTLLVTTVAIALVSLAFFHAWRNEGGNLSLDELRFFLDAYKAIGIAFLVALLGVVIPYVLPEARDKFERFKESRVAYSQAKTSVIYLPEKLASLAFAEAVAAVRDAHEKLHLAETYPRELRQHLHWHTYPDTWVDRNYWELFALRKVLVVNVDKWSNLKAGDRLQALHEALTVVEQFFGPDNLEWRRLRHPERNDAIEEALNSKVVPHVAKQSG